MMHDVMDVMRCSQEYVMTLRYDFGSFAFEVLARGGRAIRRDMWLLCITNCVSDALSPSYYIIYECLLLV